MSGWLWYVGAMWIDSRNILKVDPTRFLMDWMRYMRKITLVHILGKMGLLLIEMKRQQLEQVGGGEDQEFDFGCAKVEMGSRQLEIK